MRISNVLRKVSLLCLGLLLTRAAMAQSVPAPGGFVPIQNAQVKELIFSIAPPASLEKPVAAFARSTDMGLLLGTKVENRPAAFATVKVTTFTLDQAKFRKLRKISVEAIQETLKDASIQQEAEADAAAIGKKYKVNLSVVAGSNIFLGDETLSDRSFLYGFISAGNRVKTAQQNYVVDYYNCIASVYAKSRLYTFTLFVPVKGSGDIGPVKAKMRRWVQQFLARNGAS
jgi:hypothetical protein